MGIKQEKLGGLLKELAARFLQIESAGTSMITVTDCRVSDNARSALVFITVLPEEGENPALDFVKRKRSDFRNYVKSNARMQFIPFIDFAIDKGEKNRQHIDELLRT